MRGAFNHILTLTDEQRKRGVVAASAGNHAQGVAYAASQLGVRSTIVDVVVVDEPAIERAIERAIVDRLRQGQVLLEGAAAAVVAAALGPLRGVIESARVALVLSGGNIDLARLTPMIVRALDERGYRITGIGHVPHPASGVP